VEIVAIVFGALLIVGLTLTCCLFCAIPSEEAIRKAEKKRLMKEARKMNEHNYQTVPIQGQGQRY
jgi:hypothetical protein